MRALITGGSGYLGQLLIAGLVERGFDCVAVDIREGAPVGPGSMLVRGNAADAAVLERAARNGKIDVVFHLASQIDFAADSQTALYDNNVGTTRAVAEFAKASKVPKVVFTSSNSVYLGNRLKRPLLENDAPEPADEYGRSKVDSEKLLAGYSSDFDSISIRCPNIMDAGRLCRCSLTSSSKGASAGRSAAATSGTSASTPKT
jgi:UDP-glucose 4-epimerase